MTAWAFPRPALGWRKDTATTVTARWVFLDGSPPIIPDRPPLRVRGAVLAGIVVGLTFWLLFQLPYHRGHFPKEIGDGILSTFLWLAAWTGRLVGREALVQTVFAIGFQGLAAAIAAGRARRLPVVCGLFAASVAG